MRKYVKMPKSDLSYLDKGHLEPFKRTHLLAVNYYPSWEDPCKNREKVTNSFRINGRNMSKCVKNAKFWSFLPWKGHLARAQENMSADSLLVPFWAALCQNRDGSNGLQVQKDQNLTFPTLTNDL